VLSSFIVSLPVGMGMNCCAGGLVVEVVVVVVGVEEVVVPPGGVLDGSAGMRGSYFGRPAFDRFGHRRLGRLDERRSGGGRRLPMRSRFSRTRGRVLLAEFKTEQVFGKLFPGIVARSRRRLA
jgi:hypothetical protein